MIDVNTPVTNPTLVQSMKELKINASPENEHAFWDEVRKSKFLAPIWVTPNPEATNADGRTTLTEGTKITFQMISDENDSVYFPAFTDWGELHRWNSVPNQITLVTSFDDYCSMIFAEGSRTEGIVINPIGDNMLLNRTVLARAQGVSIPYTVEKETTVKLGIPNDYPYKMVDAIKRHLKSQKSVRKAYLLLMEKEGERSYLMIVDFANADRRSLFNGIGQLAGPFLHNMYLDMVPYDDDFGKDAADGVKPFYEKKHFGLF